MPSNTNHMPALFYNMHIKCLHLFYKHCHQFYNKAVQRGTNGKTASRNILLALNFFKKIAELRKSPLSTKGLAQHALSLSFLAISIHRHVWPWKSTQFTQLFSFELSVCNIYTRCHHLAWIILVKKYLPTVCLWIMAALVPPVALHSACSWHQTEH